MYRGEELVEARDLLVLLAQVDDGGLALADGVEHEAVISRGDVRVGAHAQQVRARPARSHKVNFMPDIGVQV